MRDSSLYAGITTDHRGVSCSASGADAERFPSLSLWYILILLRLFNPTALAHNQTDHRYCERVSLHNLFQGKPSSSFQEISEDKHVWNEIAQGDKCAN